MQKKAWNLVANSVDFNLEIDVHMFSQLVQKDNSILDYGCGYGRICEVLTSYGYNSIIGVDTSSEMIKRGNFLYPHLSLYESKDYRIKYPDCHFDAIILCAVLTCIPEDSVKKKIVSEIERVLIPGGIIHLVEFCSETEKSFESNFGVNMHHQTPSFIKALVCCFSGLAFETKQMETMNGREALAVKYFGKKDT